MAHLLFANSGLQWLFVYLSEALQDARYADKGWQYCRVPADPGDQEPVKNLSWVQWQLCGGRNARKLFLVVDTTLGRGMGEEGYIRSEGGFVDDEQITIENWLDEQGNEIKGLPPVELLLRPISEGEEAKDVHLVVDFGNSRTGALVLEMSGQQMNPKLEMYPFPLINRYRMDAWTEKGFKPHPSSLWIHSKTCWCTTPYRPPQEVFVEEDHPEIPGQIIRRPYVPRVMQDFSLLRMGPEAHAMCHVMQAGGNIRSGVSSPKRYLWADDDRWLDSSMWYMADPFDREGNPHHSIKLNGPLLAYIDENDEDRLLQDPAPYATTAPNYAHAPRTLMIGALYELLCQAYTYVNSLGFREQTGDSDRPRRIKSLTLSYPSGMMPQERERFEIQAKKAAIIFHQTLGHQQRKPDVSVRIDEASAVHLTYIWSELLAIGLDANLWFSTIGRDRRDEAPATPVKSPTPEQPPQPKPGRVQRQAKATGPEVRIACIDIGGGTTDLMIGRYWCEPGTADVIHGSMLHRDGISVAGDRLVKSLLEELIVPCFAYETGLDLRPSEDDADAPDGIPAVRYFGPLATDNRRFRQQRIDWMNRLFVPLAHRYLENAVKSESPEEDVRESARLPITHTDPELVDDDVLKRLEAVINKEYQSGQYNIRTDLPLTFDRAEFEKIAGKVLFELLSDFCCRIVEHDADIVLLAGQPSKLGYVQRLVRKFLPLHESRVIPMNGYYAGDWYPYYDRKRVVPGYIADPKSAVVVGSAIEYQAREHKLHGFQFRVDPALVRYHWGKLNLAQMRIDEDSVYFSPGGNNRFQFELNTRQVVIGRRLSADPEAEAEPAYVLEVDIPDAENKDINVRISLELYEKDHHEMLRLGSGVGGKIGEDDAEVDVNVHLRWRTMADEHFFLDTGELQNIALLH